MLEKLEFFNQTKGRRGAAAQMTLIENGETAIQGAQVHHFLSTLALPGSGSTLFGGMVGVRWTTWCYMVVVRLEAHWLMKRQSKKDTKRHDNATVPSRNYWQNQGMCQAKVSALIGILMEPLTMKNWVFLLDKFPLTNKDNFKYSKHLPNNRYFQLYDSGIKVPPLYIFPTRKSHQPRFLWISLGASLLVEKVINKSRWSGISGIQPIFSVVVKARLCIAGCLTPKQNSTNSADVCLNPKKNTNNLYKWFMSQIVFL